MKNIEIFISQIIKEWRKEKKPLLESAGLGELSNREYGDIAEEYIKNKVEKISPTYRTYLSTGSQTPADIFAISRRNGYWHIMLIQVKSSDSISKIYRLDEDDVNEFKIFAKYFKNKLLKSTLLEEYKDKSIVISIGYCGVLRIYRTTNIQHRLYDYKVFGVLKMNSSSLDLKIVNENILKAHSLSIT
jgi:hypothetical protein